jgi:hypothetical protein
MNAVPGKQFKGLFTTPTAEKYLRDTTRVIIESASDTLRGLRPNGSEAGRYDSVTSKLRMRKKGQADQER